MTRMKMDIGQKQTMSFTKKAVIASGIPKITISDGRYGFGLLIRFGGFYAVSIDLNPSFLISRTIATFIV